ncbi:unknown [Prevotella sp. CAG:474]|nr:unknown [Prevotella sp. CAG:474]
MVNTIVLFPIIFGFIIEGTTFLAHPYKIIKV